MQSCPKSNHAKRRLLPILALVMVVASFPPRHLMAEVCTTQSQMPSADKDTVSKAAVNLATKIQANDAAAVRLQTVSEYATNFSGTASLIADTASHLKGGSLAVDQVYLLDATSLKTLGDGTNQDAQFFCSLNKSIAEVQFLIPSLPPGKYAFAIVNAQNAKAPWRLSFLLRQGAGGWQMAGFYPMALTAAGHDGLWYWTHARDLAKAKQLWTAYLYYQEAQTLLQPTGFVTSTHLENLRKEAATAVPPSLSAGISADVPLVVEGPKDKNGKAAEYRFTALTSDDSLGADKIDIVVHLAPDAPPEPADTTRPAPKSDKTPELSPRDRNAKAMAALLTAYPELRANFHGVWVFADAPGKNPFVTEASMADIH